MRGVYSHITAGMREDLTVGLQDLWGASLHERARISTRSPVPVLDALLAGFRKPMAKIGSHSAPKSDTCTPEGPASSRAGPLTCAFSGGERGDSNPRHPGPQQCCHGEEALENPCLPGIPGPEVGIFTPVEGHLRPCRLPHSWPHSRSPRKLCSSAIRAGCDRSAITSASLQPIRPGTVRQRAGRE
jgi:hypothetical protein